MNLKIASYNISGGFYEDDQSVDFFDKNKSDNIDLRLLNDIVNILNNEDIDIICFQEIITTERINYINLLMEKTKLKYEEHFELSPCAIVKDTDCGVAILSKYPITNSIKKMFTNPKLAKTTSSGNTYYTYDKGFLMSEINVNGTNVSVLTHHGFPFRRFNSTPEANESVFIEFDNYIKQYNPVIVTGDFNSENFIEMMPYTKDNYIKTITEVTTDDGMKFDNILIRNKKQYTSKVIKSLSDHFIVVDEIEL